MRNWKLGTRIGAGFGALLLITMLLGFMALNRIGVIRTHAADIADNSIPSVELWAQVRFNSEHTTQLIMHLMQSTSDAEADQYEQQIQEVRTNQAHLLERYEKDLISNDEDRRDLEAVKEARTEYWKTGETILKMCRIRTPESNAKTMELARQSLFPAADKYAQAVTTEVELNVRLSDESAKSIDSSVITARLIVFACIGVALLLGIVIAVTVVRSITVPIRQAVSALDSLAEGDLTVQIDVHSRDEVGQMIAALNKASARLNRTMQDVALSAANARSSSQQLASASQSIASGAQEQAASLEETSASLEQITSSVRLSADNAQQASQLAVGSKDSALQGQEVVSSAITAMAEINAASAKISDIISTIDEIAFQTNLLAVNAAVEAARAGEEGRGFAVVAAEVRSLAQRSAVAAKEIKGLIQDSLRKVQAGSDLVNRSGETLHGIVGSARRVTDIVAEMAAAAREQSSGIEQVNSAMTQMDQVTQANSAQTEELSATADALSQQAADLLSLVKTFRLRAEEQETLRFTAARDAIHAPETKKTGAFQRKSKGIANPKTIKSQPVFSMPGAATSPAGEGTFEEF